MQGAPNWAVAPWFRSGGHPLVGSPTCTPVIVHRNLIQQTSTGMVLPSAGVDNTCTAYLRGAF